MVVQRQIEIRLPRPHDGQQQCLDEAKRFNVCCMGRRWGKTTMGLFLAIMPAAKGQPVGWFAPTYKFLDDAWRQIVGALVNAEVKISVQQRRIEFPYSGGSIEFWSMEDADPARGRKYKRLVIDEAGIIRDLDVRWQQAVRPTLTDLKGDAWFLGTPKGASGYFSRLFTKGQGGEPDWISWRLPTTSNPCIDPSEVESARRDMPEKAFAQEYLGIPADDGGNPFGLSAIRECAVAELSPDKAVAYGIDLAKSADWTVLVGLDGQGRVCRLDRWQSDWGQTRRRILETVGQTYALIDSTGVGDPIVEDLCRERRLVAGFKFSAQSKQQLMEGLAASIQRREIRFPDGWLTGELENFEYTYYAGGVRYSAPEGLHDDGVCALALAVRKWKELEGQTLNARAFGGVKMQDERSWTSLLI